MESPDLERRVDRALKALPDPVAPPALLPRVMAAMAHVRPAPWYSRTWLTWPLGAQAVSIVLLALAGAAAWWTMPLLSAWVDGVATSVTPFFAKAASATTGLREGLVAGRVIWSAALEPVILVLAVLAAALSVLTAAYWSVINRLVPGGTLQ
jgi:hypothetical protein